MVDMSLSNSDADVGLDVLVALACKDRHIIEDDIMIYAVHLGVGVNLEAAGREIGIVIYVDWGCPISEKVGVGKARLC